MINPELFYNELKNNDINFFTGVPDSLLKDICAVITDKSESNRNIIAANEGNAIALASGYHLATGNLPLVYMQNSGIGNAINPLLSLSDTEVYSIPMIMMVGWRGQPGIKDEPQHIKQGKVTLSIFDAIGIEYVILPSETEKAKKTISELALKAKENKKPYALIVEKNTFDKYKYSKTIEVNSTISRETAIKCVVDSLDEKDVVISTTGKISRELFEYRTERKQSHESDFLTVGSMGHSSQIALGIALEKPHRQIYCLDGDGALIMHTGGMGIIGDYNTSNFKHIILNNGAHESVGGQPTIGNKVDFLKVADGFNYKQTFSVSSLEELKKTLYEIKTLDGPLLLEIKVTINSRADLGRPTTSPIENKIQFENFLRD